MSILRQECKGQGVSTQYLPENLYILRDIGCEILHRPGAQNGVLVGGRLVGVATGSENEARLRLGHAGPRQITVLQAGTLQI